MKRIGKLLGFIGLLVLGFGLVGWCGYGFSGSPAFLKALILSHPLLGLGLLVAWFVLYGSQHMRDAGGVVRGRAARFGANVLLYSIVFFGVLGAVNWLGAQHARRWDLTAEGVYSLAPQSQSIISALKKPLELVAFKNEQLDEESIKQLFALYQGQNPKLVKTEIIDPETKPHLVEKYQMKPGNLVYIQYGSEDQQAVSRLNEFSEDAITNAVLKLTRGAAKKVFFVEGHGEPSIEDANKQGVKSLADALKDEHFNVEKIFLAQVKQIPEDAAAVILIAPKQDLLPSERQVLIDYAAGGGRLLLLTDPRSNGEVAKLADHFGIEVDNDLVVDLVARLFNAPTIGVDIVATDYAAHSATKVLSSANKTIFSLASSVHAKNKDAKAGGAESWTELVKSGPNSWGETNLAAIFDSQQATAEFDSKDIKGPVALAVAYEKKLSKPSSGAAGADDAQFDKASRVVVFGDSDWVRNGVLGYFSNRDLLLNVVSWLAGEEGGVTIRPRSYKSSMALIPAEDFKLIFTSSFLLPELLFVLGIVVWWRRRTVSE